MVEVDLGRDISLCAISVEWKKGEERKYTFELSASENRNDFKTLFHGPIINQNSIIF